MVDDDKNRWLLMTGIHWSIIVHANCETTFRCLFNSTSLAWIPMQAINNHNLSSFSKPPKYLATLLLGRLSLFLLNCSATFLPFSFTTTTFSSILFSPNCSPNACHNGITIESTRWYKKYWWMTPDSYKNSLMTQTACDSWSPTPPPPL